MPSSRLRVNARPISKAHRAVPAAEDVINDIAFLPDVFGMPLRGSCLEPEFHDGDVLLFDKTAPCRAGDFVVAFRRQEATPAGSFQGFVKKLIMPAPSWVSFPWSDHPESEVAPLVGLEMLNPRRQFFVRCADLLGLVRCLGIAPAGTTRATMAIPACRTGGTR